MKRIKAILFYLAASLFAVGAVGFTSMAQAATNQFVAKDPYTGVSKVYSVADVRMISTIASPQGFVLQYNDGNNSDAFADPGYAKLASLLMTAPALANYIQVGTSGVYLSRDHIKKAQCQWGASFVEATDTGDHIMVTWSVPGYVILPDVGCATVNAMKNAAVH